MLAINRNEFNVKKTTEETTVENTPTARLMYYLNCVDSVLDLSEMDGIRKLTDYGKYYLLNRDEKKELLVLCALLNPEILEDKVFFNVESGYDSGNEFFEIEKVQTTVAVTSGIMIGNKSMQVRKIMFYKRSWLRKNFSEPLLELKNQFVQSTAIDSSSTSQESNIINQPPTYTSVGKKYSFGYKCCLSCIACLCCI